MRTTNFKIKNRQIERLNYEPVIVGYKNVDTFHFEFDDEWDGLDKTLSIKVDDNNYYSVALLNGEAILPFEVYGHRTITIGVFGLKDDNTILSTVLACIPMQEGAYREGQEPDNLPTPTQWDLYIAEINKLLKSCQLSEEACRNALADLLELSKQYVSEIDDMRNETQNFRNETSKLKDDTQAIVDDVKDMVSAMTFTTFEVDPKTGELFINSAESLGNMGFSVEEDGNLYVEIGEKEVQNG